MKRFAFTLAAALVLASPASAATKLPPEILGRRGPPNNGKPTSRARMQD
jgi:hypothetical protein